MPLSDVEIPSAEIALGEAKLRLTALSLSDLSILLEHHGQALASVVSVFAPIGREPFNERKLALLLLSRNDLIAEAIALSAGEARSQPILDRMSAFYQFQAFTVVIRLTLMGLNPALILSEMAGALSPVHGMVFGGTSH